MPIFLIGAGSGGVRASRIAASHGARVAVAEVDGPQAQMVEQVAQVNSKDMTLALWQSLVRRLAHHLARPEVGAVIVTHGTDTIEETAFLLQTVLKPSKPVVLTCAMRPATALVPDGPQNLSDAVAVALHPEARGVVVVCAGRIHGAIDVAKVHPYRTDPFDSGDAGLKTFLDFLIASLPITRGGLLEPGAVGLLTSPA